jgi:hypothetical protein
MARLSHGVADDSVTTCKVSDRFPQNLGTITLSFNFYLRRET